MPQHTFARSLEFASLRLLETLIHAVPRTLALAVGSMAGDLLRRAGYHRSIVRKNFEYAGIWDAGETARIEKRLYRNIGRYGADFLRPADKIPPYTADHFELIDALLRRGKGIIVLLGHFGNWEMLARIFGRKVERLHVIARPMKNKMTQAWLAEKRALTGVQTIYANKALRKSLRVLKNNGLLATLIDQHAREQGTDVPFLGKPANTLRAIAGLQRVTDCAILPTYALLQKDGSYRVHITSAEALDIDPANEDAFIAAHQKQHNDILSAWITSYPDHWFGWFHRRFKGNVQY
ncbi:MAG: hypothetical protein GF398_17540 [Chitinivibrionales bacterium]|nr:hypothetical protein [Chitinivibrionales bacterium]